MGHTALPTAPRSKSWERLRDAVSEGASPTVIASLTLQAASRQLDHAAQGARLAPAIRLLVYVPESATAGSFAPALRSIGVPSRDEPTIGDLIAGCAEALDAPMRVPGGRDDLGEVARRALLSSLSVAASSLSDGAALQSAEATRLAFAQLAGATGFSRLVRLYHGRLFSNVLGLWLDRLLSAEIGADRAFVDLDRREALSDAIDGVCGDATEVLREFARGAYPQLLRPGRGVDEARTERFAEIAFGEVRAELIRLGSGDA